MTRLPWVEGDIVVELNCVTRKSKIWRRNATGEWQAGLVGHRASDESIEACVDKEQYDRYFYAVVRRGGVEQH